MRITISATGIDKTINDLTNLVKQFGDHTDFLRSVVVPLLKRDFREVFASRGYGTCRPNAPSTVRDKGQGRV